MITQILSDILIFISSTVKFALSSSAVVTGNMGISGTIANVLGGITGVVVFTYLGGYMRTWIVKTFPERFEKKFTKSSRFLVRVKRHSGLFGVALITPIFLSIPVGVMLALDLTTHKRKIVTSMALSCFFWSAVFFVPYYAFSIDVIGWVKGMF
jgi:hypothetical protein